MVFRINTVFHEGLTVGRSISVAQGISIEQSLSLT